MSDVHNISKLFAGYAGSAFDAVLFDESKNRQKFYCGIIKRVPKKFKLIWKILSNIATDDLLEEHIINKL